MCLMEILPRILLFFKVFYIESFLRSILNLFLVFLFINNCDAFTHTSVCIKGALLSLVNQSQTDILIEQTTNKELKRKTQRRRKMKFIFAALAVLFIGKKVLYIISVLKRILFLRSRFIPRRFKQWYNYISYFATTTWKIDFYLLTSTLTAGVKLNLASFYFGPKPFAHLPLDQKLLITFAEMKFGQCV